MCCAGRARYADGHKPQDSSGPAGIAGTGAGDPTRRAPPSTAAGVTTVDGGGVATIGQPLPF